MTVVSCSRRASERPALGKSSRRPRRGPCRGGGLLAERRKASRERGAPYLLCLAASQSTCLWNGKAPVSAAAARVAPRGGRGRGARVRCRAW